MKRSGVGERIDPISGPQSVERKHSTTDVVVDDNADDSI
jgi:hypothetical protein